MKTLSALLLVMLLSGCATNMALEERVQWQNFFNAIGQAHQDYRIQKLEMQPRYNYQR